MSDFNFEDYKEKADKLTEKLKSIEKLVYGMRLDVSVGRFLDVKEDLVKLQEMVDLADDLEGLLPEEVEDNNNIINSPILRTLDSN